MITHRGVCPGAWSREQTRLPCCYTDTEKIGSDMKKYIVTARDLRDEFTVEEA